MVSGVLITLVLIVAYVLLIVILRRTGLFQKLNMSMMGPLLLIRTQRGKRTIERISKLGRFWKWFANIGLVITYLSMFLMFATLVLSAIGSAAREMKPVPASDILVIPGVNNLIPLTFGLIALIVGIVVHEFAHGILALVAKLKVKSLGVLMLVVPIGAFVEPDEKELNNAPRIERMRVYAAGPAMNIAVGLICALIFSWGMMGSVTPVEEGVMVFTLQVGYPAEEGGIEVGMLITNMTIYHNMTDATEDPGNDSTLGDMGNLYNSLRPYGNLTADEIENKRISNETYTWLVGNNENFTITYLEVEDHDSFSDALGISLAGDRIDLGVFYKGDRMMFLNIGLADKYDFTGDEKDRGKGFLGIGAYDPQRFIDILNHPVSSADSAGEAGVNLATYAILLPMNTQMMPFHSPVTDVYEVGGFWSFLGEDGFWFLANTLYYVFWLNILIGTFNTLPCIPVDGGFLFRDTFSWIMERMGKKISEEKRDRVTKIVSISSALFIAFMIVFIIVFPYLRSYSG